jgi:IclR family transcriptional regulator, KDG regulon repressor
MATSLLDELYRQTGESSHFASCMSDALVVMKRTAGPGALALIDRVDVVGQAYCKAWGKIMSTARFWEAKRPSEAFCAPSA